MIDVASVLPVIGTWTAGSLLGLTVVMILTGRLVPRRQHDEVRQERDQWRVVALKAIGHTGELLPAAQVASQAVRALSDIAQTERQP